MYQNIVASRITSFRNDLTVTCCSIETHHKLNQTKKYLSMSFLQNNQQVINCYYINLHPILCKNILLIFIFIYFLDMGNLIQLEKAPILSCIYT